MVSNCGCRITNQEWDMLVFIKSRLGFKAGEWWGVDYTSKITGLFVNVERLKAVDHVIGFLPSM